MTRTDQELSIVCEESAAPPGASVEAGWRAFRLAGPLPFDATGVLLSVVGPLAEARVPVFALSTHDTDYVLVKDADAEAARKFLTGAGFEFEP